MPDLILRERIGGPDRRSYNDIIPNKSIDKRVIIAELEAAAHPQRSSIVVAGGESYLGLSPSPDFRVARWG
jgi:hypothetical protein